MFHFVLVCLVLRLLQTTYGGRSYPQNQKPHPQHPHSQQGGAVKMRDCEPIEVGLCRGLGYDVTGMPNLVGHETQHDAEQQLRTFTPLMQYGCSSRLTLFLCSAYVPMCTEKVLEPIGPCASLCEAVRQRCEPVLNEFGFPWPLALNCSKFPPRNEDDSMCMKGPDEDAHDQTRQRTTASQLPIPSTIGSLGTAVSENCELFRNPSNYILLNRTQRCALICSKDDVFSADQKMFADAWMSVWSGLCFVTTFISILTFLIDSSRFPYPERALVFMAFCYNVCSVSYLIRLIAGRETISCRPATDSVKVLVQEGLENTECTIVFILLYYFSTASSVWWTILTVLWFLNAGLNQSYDSLSRHGTLLHVVAWSVPAAVTIAVIVLRSVDADELTAMCQVGYCNQTTRLWFVLIPTGIFLLLGVVFLAAGFICSIRTRKESESTRSVTRFSTIRIGAFSSVHVVLTTCILSVQCYEHANRHYWLLLQPNTTASRTPNVTVLMFGVAANLTVGIISAIWLWRGESLQSWQRFCSRLCNCCCRRVMTKEGTGRKPPVALIDVRLQAPLARSRPIYRVTSEAVERSGRDAYTAWSSSHTCHHHHHHRNPLINNNGPPPPCERRSSRNPVKCRAFNSDITVL